MIPKNPLRLIVARTPIFYELYGGPLEHLRESSIRLCWFLDTLECGHQRMALNLDVPGIGKKRHRCGECAEAAKKPCESTPSVLPPKKPSVSVPAEGERKKVA